MHFRLLIAISLLLLSDTVSAQNEIVPGQMILQFDSENRVDVFTRTYGSFKNVKTELKPAKLLSRRLNIWLFEFNNASANAESYLQAIRDSKFILNAQFNHLVELRAITPNDSLIGLQWNFDNSGQNGGMVDADIDAPEAWEISTGGLTAAGDTIVVAVIDGGFDLNHEDLDFWTNRHETPNNGIDDDGNGYVDDYNGWNAFNSDGDPHDAGFFGQHGTHVSGTVGAIGNNGVGVTGVNWNVKILPIAGSSGNEATVVEAYGYVYELRKRYNETQGDSGAYVVSTNSSFGVDFGNPQNFPIWCAMYDSMGSVGIISAAATINDNQDVDVIGDVPTACPSNFLLSVSNTTRDDMKYTWAGYGSTTIDLGAPGTEIWSTVPMNSYEGTSWTGTSMASPHVAGTVALMHAAACQKLIEDYEEKPDSVALILRNYILQSVDTILDLVGITATGGRLNLHSALLALGQYDCTPNLIEDNNSSTNRFTATIANPILDNNIPIRYSSITELWLRFSILNVFGQVVAEKPDFKIDAGRGIHVWSSSTIPAGLYFLAITDRTGIGMISPIRFVKVN